MRANAQDRGYDSRWQAASAEFKKSNPWCLGCASIGERVPATVVDHVVPHRGNQEKFWDKRNWQPCCAWHHDVVKKMLETRYDAGRVTAYELWLNSGPAIGLTKAKRKAPIGDDGWLL